MDEKDQRFLERALDLAEKGRGCTSPNPVVGAVIVRGDDIVGEGWHVGPGCDHAEVAAIKDALRRRGEPEARGRPRFDQAVARSACEGATMYVTLEPCCTHGRTPPCTSALIEGGFVRIVAGAIDPSLGVNGKGLELLRSARIEVELAEGSLAQRAKRQNDGLRKTLARGLPFVTYKYAMSIDGRVAADSGDSRWISSAESRALVHRWRAWSDAVVVGAGTVAHDDPRLTARHAECVRQPLRVVVDRDLSLLRDSNLVRTVSEGPVLVVCGERVIARKCAEVEAWGVEVRVVSCDHTGELDPVQVCRQLNERGVQTALLEGGPRLAGAWWAAGAIDKVAAFVCPVVISGERALGPLASPGAVRIDEGTKLREVEVLRVGCDVLMSGYVGGPY